MSFGMVSPVLLMGAATALLLGVQRYSIHWKLVVAAIVFFFCIAPVNDLSIAYYIRGVVGDLSITTQLILMAYWYAVLMGETAGKTSKEASGTETEPNRNNPLIFAGFIVLTSLWFYPCTLGLTYFDPYNLGYGSTPFHWCLLTYFFCAALYFYCKKDFLFSGIITLSTFAFYFNLLESDNYWDYLMDPILVLGSIFICLRWSFLATKNLILDPARKKA